jgi:hypothetical protein
LQLTLLMITGQPKPNPQIFEPIQFFAEVQVSSTIFVVLLLYLPSQLSDRLQCSFYRRLVPC